MSEAENHANSVNVDRDPPQETVISGEDYSIPIYRQSSPHGDDIAIIKAQIEEDMHDLEIFTARVEAEDLKISKQTQILLELKAELEMLQKKQQETARQLLIECDIEKSFEPQSQQFANRISSSMRAPGLMRIHSSNTDDAPFFIKFPMESLHRAQEQYSAPISELQSRLRIESTCLRLLSDRRHSLEMICDEFRGSMKRKRSVLSSKRLPTEILIQIFDLAVEEFIQNETLTSNPMGGHPALKIASVCHRWHDITTDASRLWRYIPIHKKRAASPGVPLLIKQTCQRADQTRGLLLDLTGYMDNARVAQRDLWREGLESIARSWENMEGPIPTILSINYRGEPMILEIPFKRRHTYTLYNLYPIFFSWEAVHVTSLALHFRSHPSLSRVSDLLRILQNLSSFELQFQGVLTRIHRFSCPSLRRLTIRLSMIPLFFSRERSISGVIQSLTVHADRNYHSSFLEAPTWRSTVESGGLAISLRYLALCGGESPSTTAKFMIPLLLGLQSVGTLALRGRFMTPILDKLSKDPTLLPSLHHLEMHVTDIDQRLIEEFLDSRREPREGTPAPVHIRKLVLDHCSNITRDFCDHVRGKVEKLVVYC